MRKFVFIMSIILTLGTVRCSDDQVETNACASSDPIGDVPWIAELKKSMTNCACEISLIKGTYQGQTVFFIALTDPLCNGIDTPTLYNCEGKKVREFSDSIVDQNDLRDNVTRDHVVYRCKT